MNNTMQLKAKIKNLSKSKNISAQIILQNYMLERLLERISLSEYRLNFILKGGLLIASMVGLDTRATMDMDATLRGIPVNAKAVAKMFEKICLISIDDNITFAVKHTEAIRKDDDYGGFRVSLEALYPPMAIPIKVDITTGDKITPKEISYEYPLMFEQRTLKVLAYNLETVLAEKIETVLSRGDQNTRPRDYYDIFTMQRLQWDKVNISLLHDALTATAKKRNTLSVLDDYPAILKVVENSAVMKSHWSRYQKQFHYAKDISFEDVCKSTKEICDLLFIAGQ